MKHSALLLISGLLAGLLFPVSTFSQDETPEELFEDGDFFFAREEYEEAAYLYRQLVNAEPENHNAHYKLGMAYLNIEAQESYSIEHFLKATENTSLKYRKNYYPEKRAPHHTWFFLGDAYRVTNQLDEALEAYQVFKEADGFERHYNERITNEQIKAVQRAKIIQDAPLELYTSCFEEPLNTTQKEYRAVISANERVMVWLNSQKFYEAILMSIKQDGKWSDPVNITPQVGSDGDLIPTGLSANGTELLLVRLDELDNDIYSSRSDGTFWTRAEPVRGDLNSNFTEDHASFHPDGSKIYLSSDRRGTTGGLDIWISTKREDGSWSDPVNAGPMINTENDETSAYISPDTKKIFFASKGHFNMGGYDIFVSDIKEDGTFSYTYNIGYPINNTGDNTYFIPVKDGNTGLYTMRHEDGIGGRDLWYIEIVPREAAVAKALTRLSEEDFSIAVTDPETGEKITLDYDAVNDKITIKSKTGKEYHVVYSKERDDE